MLEEDALALEALYISMWGRKCDGGILMNASTGGKTGGTGRIRTEAERQQIRETMKVTLDKKGRLTPEERLERRRAAARRYQRKNSPTYPLYGVEGKTRRARQSA